jgi:hypothetical protein
MPLDFEQFPLHYGNGMLPNRQRQTILHRAPKLVDQ